MKLSESWLRELVNLSIDSKSLVNQMTMIGIEVNSVEPVAKQFTGIVIGKIVNYHLHPKTNKMYIVKVDIGAKKLLNIVCSASNCRANLRVAVATVNAIMPEGLKIHVAEFYEELSEGRLCSFSELGMSEEHNNIIELPTEAPIGHDIRDYLNLDDNIININVAPNRADCLSLIGIARDIAACNRLPLQMPIIKPVLSVIDDILPICVKSVDACPRYLGRIVKNINIKATTPLWMVERLRRCGFRSINPIADITNYVLIELGQPMHAFDYNQIKGGIIVRYADKDETLLLTDGRNITLFSDTVIIADHERVLALAGISGGAISNISEITNNIMLECALFNPLAIRGRGCHYKLNTDASYRYERGVDPMLQLHAMERATSLLLSICGGEPGPVIDIVSESAQSKLNIINLKRKTLNNFIGYTIKDDDVNDILVHLGYQIKNIIEGWQVIVPSWRFDITIEKDLIEDIVRMYGYDSIPNISVRGNLLIPNQQKTILPLTRAKILLADRGYQEVITYSFVDPKKQDLIYPQQKSLMISNPISKDMSVMRLSLWPGLLNIVSYNENRQQRRIRLFESGLCFIPDETVNLGVRQELMLSGIIAGFRHDIHWDQKQQLVDFYDIKGDLEAILELTSKLDDIKFKAEHHPALHPGQSATVYFKDELIGFIGAIHPKLERKLNLNNRTLVFELFWEKIAQCKLLKFKNISRFPINRRDISIVVNDNIAAADIVAECKKINLNQLIEIKLFDVYHGQGIKKGFKSLGISLSLQDASCTMEEEDIAAAIKNCIEALKKKFQASLRV